MTPEEAAQAATRINELLATGNGQAALDEAVSLRLQIKNALVSDPSLRKNLDSVQSAIVQLQRAGFSAPPVDGLKLCPFCAEEIQAAAIKCKHCGSSLESVSIGQPGRGTPGRSGVDPKTIATVGYLGALLLFVGVFMPIIRLPYIGTISYFMNGKGDGLFILGFAALAALGTALGRAWYQLTGGLLSGGLMIFTFINLHYRLNDAREKISSDLAGNPFAGLGELAIQSVQFEWGWGCLILGVALTILSGMMSHGQQPLTSSGPSSSGAGNTWQDRLVASHNLLNDASPETRTWVLICTGTCVAVCLLVMLPSLKTVLPSRPVSTAPVPAAVTPEAPSPSPSPSPTVSAAEVERQREAERVRLEQQKRAQVEAEKKAQDARRRESARLQALAQQKAQQQREAHRQAVAAARRQLGSLVNTAADYYGRFEYATLVSGDKKVNISSYDLYEFQNRVSSVDFSGIAGVAEVRKGLEECLQHLSSCESELSTASIYVNSDYSRQSYNDAMAKAQSELGYAESALKEARQALRGLR